MQVGLIGCGVVGRQFGRTVLRAGYRLAVHDIRTTATRTLLEAGATCCATTTELAAQSELLVTALPGPAEVEQVLTESIAALPPAAGLLELSTIGPETVRRFAGATAARGVALFDAGVSISGHDPEHGDRLALWVGGEARLYRDWQSIFNPLGSPTLYCGALGAGKVTKLLNNAVAHTIVVALCEALVVGVKSGIPLEILVNALSAGTAQSRILDEILPRSLFRGDFRPGLRLELALKDLALAAAMAREQGLDLPLTYAAAEAYRRAAEATPELTAESLHAVAKPLEASAGVELRLAAFRTQEKPGGIS